MKYDMDYETAKELFDYDPETGILIWRVRPCINSHVKIGDIAGSMHNGGYRKVKFKGKMYLAHRVIWIILTGKWPENYIDHKNGIRDDNILCNLRAATRGENSQNVKSHSNTGISGVHLRKDGRYLANLRLDGKYVLGTVFKNLEDAVAAVTAAKRKYHTFHPEMVTR